MRAMPTATSERSPKTLRLRHLGISQVEVRSDVVTVLFSYDTPVAAYIGGTGYIQTSARWSRTTTGHIKSWLDGRYARMVPQETLDTLLDTLPTVGFDSVPPTGKAVHYHIHGIEKLLCAPEWLVGDLDIDFDFQRAYKYPEAAITQIGKWATALGCELTVERRDKTSEWADTFNMWGMTILIEPCDNSYCPIAV